MPEHVNAGDCMGVWAELGAQIPSESGLGVHAQPRMQSIYVTILCGLENLPEISIGFL